jgi:hypothetical protein
MPTTALNPLPGLREHLTVSKAESAGQWFFTATARISPALQLVATVHSDFYHWFRLRSPVMCATWCAPCQA